MLRSRKHIDKSRLVYLLERGMAKKGLRQADVAEKIGAAQTSVSDWALGKKLPSAQYLHKLMALLDFDWDDILNRNQLPAAVESVPEEDLRTRYRQLEARYRQLDASYRQLEERVHELESRLEVEGDARSPFRARTVTPA